MARLAWFSPVPPVRSGVAACTADLVPALRAEHLIDVFVDEPVARLTRTARSAHDFIWMNRLAPYDLTVFQVGNSSHHDYSWPYLFRFPGLTVLHDVRLHHARAAALLRVHRAADYRAEFAWNHPEIRSDLAELAVAGFDTRLYYHWPMTRLIVQASRMVAVHAPTLAEELRADIPGARIEPVRLGHGVALPARELLAARAAARAQFGLPDDAIVFGCFGGLTPEKRVPQILSAFAATLPYAPGARLLLAGSPAAHYDVAAEISRRGLEPYTHLTGYLDTDEELTGAIAASDVAMNLRWPTAGEVSGPWLRALALGRATIIVDLAHLATVPALDPRSWQPTLRRADRSAPVCVAVDISDEDHSLRLAMRRLAADAPLRAALGRAAAAYWHARHSVAGMVDDYRRLIAEALTMTAPRPPLPAHLTDCGDGVLRRVMDRFGLDSPLR